MFSQIIPNFQHHPSKSPSKITYGEVFLIIKQTIKSMYGNHEEGSEEGIHKTPLGVFIHMWETFNPI
jgi:hypothetical protein